MLNNNCTIQELREALFHKIDRLMKIEPHWNKCMHCQHHGKCCIRADVSIRADEWIIIKEYIQKLNISDKCLIHEVRPLNCIWTPFQAVQNIQTNDLTFYIPYLDCKFFRKVVKNHPRINEEFVKIKIGNKKCYYLFLNDIYTEYINNTNQPVDNLSNLINQVIPLIY